MPTPTTPPATKKLYRVEFKSVDYHFCEVHAWDENEARRRADELAADGKLTVKKYHGSFELNDISELKRIEPLVGKERIYYSPPEQRPDMFDWSKAD